MVSEGYGPDRPIASNDFGEGRSRNRRVEIVIAQGTVAEAPAPP
jgi:flagellar motor protein MotB